jgi:FkbM family methyltransferase
MIVHTNGSKIYMPDEYADQKSSKSKFSLKQRLENNLWEKEEITLLTEYLKPTDSVLELGACIGFLGVFSNKMIGGNKHTLIEANPKMLKVINKNRELNNSTFDVVNCMIGDPTKESGKFHVSDFILGSSQYLNTKNEIKIEVKPLSDFSSDHNFIIVDIEGGEYNLVNDSISELAKFSKLLIEFHDFFGFTIDDRDKALATLNSVGFKVEENMGNTYMLTK